MTEPTREEKCRVLAEWLGLSAVMYLDGWLYHHPRCYSQGRPVVTTECTILGCTTTGLDFYASEEASAQLLEKMPFPELSVNLLPNNQKEWWCSPRQDIDDFTVDPDRKAAIAEAAYAFVMRGK